MFFIYNRYMKVDKFEYKRVKRIIFDTMEELEDDNIIEKGSFEEGYFRNDLKDIIPQIDFLKLELKKKNIDLFEFIKEYEDKVFKDNEFVYDSALMDTILYTYDKNKGILQVNKLIDSQPEEYFIKYQYEYYNYDMGRRFILQSFDSMEDYYETTAKHLLYGYISNNYGVGEDVANDCSIIKKHGNGYTIYVHIRLLLNELELKSYTYDKFIDELESDMKPIPIKIQNGILEIFIGYKFHKISDEELEDITSELESKFQAHKYNL